MSKSLPDLCIGSDGPNVRPIGIGTNAWGGVQAANSIPTNSIAVVKSALESGVRFFDTADNCTKALGSVDGKCRP